MPRESTWNGLRWTWIAVPPSRIDATSQISTVSRAGRVSNAVSGLNRFSALHQGATSACVRSAPLTVQVARS